MVEQWWVKARSVIKLMYFSPQHSTSLIFREVRRESEEGDIIKVEERVFKKKVLCIRCGGEIKQTEVSEKIMRLGRGAERPILGSRRFKAIFSGVKEICLFPTRLVFYVVSVVSYSFFSWYLWGLAQTFAHSRHQTKILEVGGWCWLQVRKVLKCSVEGPAGLGRALWGVIQRGTDDWKMVINEDNMDVSWWKTMMGGRYICHRVLSLESKEKTVPPTSPLLWVFLSHCYQSVMPPKPTIFRWNGGHRNFGLS